jgi:hypothetical protein
MSADDFDLNARSGVLRPRPFFTIALAVEVTREIANMTSFLSLHAAAAARGDGLHPELLALVAGIAPHPVFTPRHDGMIQSGPDPATARLAGKPANVAPFPQAAASGTLHPHIRETAP